MNGTCEVQGSMCQNSNHSESCSCTQSDDISREQELDILFRQLPIHSLVRRDARLNLLRVLGIEIHLHHAPAANTEARPLSDPMCGEHDIVENGSLHRRNRLRARPRCVDFGIDVAELHHFALCDEEHIFVAELLPM